MIKTEEIYNALKETVVGQDEYIKQLALTGYKHQLKQRLIKEGKEPINTNLLVIGPSGCGKTFAVKQMANLLDIPFHEVDCANLVQVGYKGTANIEDHLAQLIDRYSKDSLQAIVYLDEFDKIFDMSMFVDGKGKGSQQNFLKILENNEVVVSRGDRYSSKMPFNTSGLTFIATGSFEMVKEKMHQSCSNNMGFNAVNKKKQTIELTDKDLIDFGYMPELVGRFSNIININQLSEEDFYNIVKNSKDSAFKQYESLFNIQNVELKVNDNVYRNIASKAYNSTVGARGLNRILNNVLDDCLYDVSNDSNINYIEINCKDDKYIHTYNRDKHRTFIKEIGIAIKRRINLEDAQQFFNDAIDDCDLKLRDSKLIKESFKNVIENYCEQNMDIDKFITVINNNRNDLSLKVSEGLLDLNDDQREMFAGEFKAFSLLLEKYKEMSKQIMEVC